MPLLVCLFCLYTEGNGINCISDLYTETVKGKKKKKKRKRAVLRTDVRLRPSETRIPGPCGKGLCLVACLEGDP